MIQVAGDTYPLKEFLGGPILEFSWNPEDATWEREVDDEAVAGVLENLKVLASTWGYTGTLTQH